MQVGVVIICYQQAQYLSEAMRSLSIQTYEDWEAAIVCGDMASFVKAGEDLTHDDERFYPVWQNPSGIGAARNFGALHLDTPMLLMLDADDKLDPTFLEKTVAVMRDKPEISIVYTDAQCFGKHNSLWKCGEFSREALWQANQLPYCSLMRREVWEKTGGYATEPGLIEDWDFWLKAAEQGFKAARIWEPLFKYRVMNGSGLDRAKASMGAHQELVRARHPLRAP